MNSLKLRRNAWIAIPALVLIGFGVFWWLSPFRKGWQAGNFKYLPPNAPFAVHVDMAALRDNPIVKSALLSQSPPLEGEYADFVRSTGFDYERDLDTVDLAISGPQQARVIDAVLEGRFHREKIDLYIEKHRKFQSFHANTNIEGFQGADGKQFRIAFIGSGRLLFSNAPREEPMSHMIELSRRKGDSLGDRLRALHVESYIPAGSQVWASLDMQHDAQLVLPTAPGSTTSFTADLLHGSEVTILSARVNNTDVGLQLLAKFGNEVESQRATKALNGMKQLLGALAVRDKSEPGAEAFVQMLRQVQVDNQKNAAVVSLTLPASALQQLFQSRAREQAPQQPATPPAK